MVPSASTTVTALGGPWLPTGSSNGASWITRRRSCIIQDHIDGVIHGGLVDAGLPGVFIPKQSPWILSPIRWVVAKLVTSLLKLFWILV